MLFRSVLIIDRNEEDQYLMFACDGIWDAIPDPQACVETMNQFLVGEGEAGEA